MLSESEMKGYFNTPPSVQEQMIELEKKLYYKFAKQWDNQLFFFLSFAKQDTSNEQGYQYNFIPLKVETKEELVTAVLVIFKVFPEIAGVVIAVE